MIDSAAGNLADGVASVGECMLELSRGGDRTWKMGFAGDAFNTLWAIRALIGAEPGCDFVSAFGDDPFSRDQIAFFAENGIGIAASPIVAGARPGLYAITLDGAERSFTYWRNDAAARQLASDGDRLRESLAGRSLIYFSGITLAILAPEARAGLFDALREARSPGCSIAFDPNYRPHLWADRDEARRAIDEALGVCDIALPTLPDEQALFGDGDAAETASRIAGRGVAEVLVKNGAEPALLVRDRRPEWIEAVTVAPLDTTGAGDAFNGAYLAARLLGGTPAEAARKAHRVAAAVVQVRGALAPMDILREAFMPG